jgi:hypothetical protein
LSKNKSYFNRWGALFLTVSLYGIIHTISSKHPLTTSIEIKPPKSEQAGLFSMLTLNNKWPKWLKFIIFIIIYLFIGYIIIFVYPNIIKFIKLLSILGICLFILYNLLNVLIIIICNNKKHDIKISKYYPKFIKSHLIYLMSIRNIEGVNLFIEIYLKNAIFSLILLILFIFINTLILSIF